MMRGEKKFFSFKCENSYHIFFMHHSLIFIKILLKGRKKVDERIFFLLLLLVEKSACE